MLKAFETQLAEHLQETVKQKIGPFSMNLREFGAWRELVKEKDQWGEETLRSASTIILKIQDGGKKFKIEGVKVGLQELTTLKDKIIKRAQSWGADKNDELAEQLGILSAAIIDANILMVEYGYVSVLSRKVSDQLRASALAVEDKARILRNVGEEQVLGYFGSCRVQPRLQVERL